MSHSTTISRPVSDDWPPFALTAEPLATGLVLTVTGDLDLATAPELRERLIGAIEAGATAIVVDLHGITFMDSCGLAALLHARARLASQGRLALVLASDSYAHLILEVAGLPRSLALFETREEATIHALGSAPA
jgi:anti-sigma B factor antagonist